MRRFLFLTAVVLLGVATVSASTMCTGSTGTDVIGTPGFSCDSLGGLTFSGFSAVNAGNVPTPSVFLVSVQDTSGGIMLNFNPGLLTGNQDIWFYFQVTGSPVLGVDLTNGATGVTSIAERVCSGPIQPGNVCAEGQEVATLSAASGQSAQVWFESPQASLYIFKDIGTESDGHMSSFSQSFDTPEPVTFGLIGGGLLLLGLLRCRTRG